jgi:hypothetical protein
MTIQVADFMALRPAISLGFSSQPDADPSYAYTSFSIGPRIDALFLIPVASGLSFGIGPRLCYNFQSQTYDYVVASSGTTTAITGTLQIGAVGFLQYLFAKNFGAFLGASLSIGFGRWSSENDKASSNPDPTTWTDISTLTSLGLVFYLK